MLKCNLKIKSLKHEIKNILKMQEIKNILKYFKNVKMQFKNKKDILK